MAKIFLEPQTRILGLNLEPLSGGKVYFYEAGSTTPKDTYTDSTEATTNDNPVVLDSNGRANIWLATDKNYKAIVKDSDDRTLFVADNLSPGGSIISSLTRLGGNLIVGDYSIISSSNNNIPITPDGVGTTNITNLNIMSDADFNGYSFKVKDLTGFLDSSENQMLLFDKNTAAANYTQINNTATGTGLSIKALGDATNIDFTIVSKGAGVLNVTGSNHTTNISDDDDLVTKGYLDSNFSLNGYRLTYGDTSNASFNSPFTPNISSKTKLGEDSLSLTYKINFISGYSDINIPFILVTGKHSANIAFERSRTHVIERTVSSITIKAYDLFEPGPGDTSVFLSIFGGSLE